MANLPNNVVVATTVSSNRPVMVTANLSTMCDWLTRTIGDCESIRELRGCGFIDRTYYVVASNDTTFKIWSVMATNR